MNLSKKDISTNISKYVKFELIDSSLPDLDKRNFEISFQKIKNLNFSDFEITYDDVKKTNEEHEC